MANTLNFPSTDLAKIVWIHMVLNGLPEYGELCGLSPEKAGSAIKNGLYYLQILKKQRPAALR